MTDTRKRYKTAFLFKCVEGHQNLWEDRSLAETAEAAQEAASNRVRQERCRYCGHTVVAVSTIGTEEISRYPELQALGYICKCGERVTVFQEEQDKSIAFPDEITISCSQGHSRKILNHEFLSLERWEEQTN
jgi:hypothetical protein